MQISTKARARLLAAAAGVAAVVALESGGEASADVAEDATAVEMSPESPGDGLSSDAVPEPAPGPSVSVEYGGENTVPEPAGPDVLDPVLPIASDTEAEKADGDTVVEVVVDDSGPAAPSAVVEELPALVITDGSPVLPDLVMADLGLTDAGARGDSPLPTPLATAAAARSPLGEALGVLSFFGLVSPWAPSPQAPAAVASWTSMLWWTGRVRNYLDNHQPSAGVPSRVYDAVTGVATGSLNFSDRDGDQLSYEVVSGPSHGTVVVNSDGTYTYVAGDAIKANGGTDAFTVRVTDNAYPHLHGISGLLDLVIHWGQHEHGATQTVVLNTLPPGSQNPDDPNNPGNPDVLAPVIDSISIPDIAPNASSGTITVIAHAKDGGNVSVVVLPVGPANGVLTDLGNGSYRYTPNAAARLQQGSTQQFRVVVVDDKGRSTTKVIDVNVEKGNLYTGRIDGISSHRQVVVSPDGTRAYVSSSYSGGVTIIDTISGEVVRTVILGPMPATIALSADGSVVTAATPESIYLIDTETGRVQAHLVISNGSTIDDMSFSGDRKSVAVVQNSPVDGSFLVFFGADFKNGKTPVRLDGTLHSVAMSADGSRAYVTNGQEQSISVIGYPDGGSNPVILETIAIGDYPAGQIIIASTSEGDRVLFATETGTIMVLNPTTNSVEKVIELGAGPGPLAASPDGRVFVATDAGVLVEVDLATGDVTPVAAANPRTSGIAFSPDGSHVYLTAYGSYVRVIDLGAAKAAPLLTGI